MVVWSRTDIISSFPHFKILYSTLYPVWYDVLYSDTSPLVRFIVRVLLQVRALIFSVVDRGKLLQYKLIHVPCRKQSTPVPVSHVPVNKVFLFSDLFWEKLARIKILCDLMSVAIHAAVRRPDRSCFDSSTRAGFYKLFTRINYDNFVCQYFQFWCHHRSAAVRPLEIN